MPESVTDRPTKSHEQVFLLTKEPRYFFDQEAVREPHRPDGREVTTRTVSNGSHANYQEFGHDEGRERWPNGGRNVRSVWEIATQPYAEAHFATFPEALVERCVKAGTSERGCCPECGAPWERETVDTPEYAEKKTALRDSRGGSLRSHDLETFGLTAGVHDVSNPSISRDQMTIGWRATCRHQFGTSDRTGEPVYADFPPVPCVVLDPFMGSGTTALVARRLGRRSVGIELNADYAELAARRLNQLSLLAL